MLEGVKSIKTISVANQKILVRGDFDVENAQNPRTESVRDIVKWLTNQAAGQIKVIGHRETDYPICDDLRREFPGVEFDDQVRADPGEKTNDEEYAKKLAEGWDVYVNEAFATSHRKHASIIAVPEYMKKEGKEVGMGLRFEKELEMLGKISMSLSTSTSTGVGTILVIGGTKIDDKQKFVETMGSKFTAVLTGGLLPGTVRRPDGLDIADETIEKYEKEIAEAETILAAGVMGKYENESSSSGTKRILEAIANNALAYKVAGGGDIEAAISRYGLTEKFDWISVGGGAMLVYLETGTLPGIEALKILS